MKLPSLIISTYIADKSISAFSDYDNHGPVGPTAFWKVSNSIAGPDDDEEEEVFDLADESDENDENGEYDGNAVTMQYIIGLALAQLDAPE